MSQASFLSIQEAIQQGTEMLDRATVGAPRLTAEVLLAHAVQRDRAYLYSHATDPLSELAWIHYGRYLNERLKGRPTQYITHSQEFWGLDFYVDDRVLIPRPETEHLVELALSYLQSHNCPTVVDVGTGSGAIAISVSRATQRLVFASDISPDALQVAYRNNKALGAKVELTCCDLLDCFADRSIDLLLSNPPYVPGADQANMQREVRDWEPHVALFAGDTGLEIYRRLLAGAERAMRPGARLLMELGFQSLEGVRALLPNCWIDVEVVHDLAGWPRVLGLTLQP